MDAEVAVFLRILIYQSSRGILWNTDNNLKSLFEFMTVKPSIKSSDLLNAERHTICICQKRWNVSKPQYRLEIYNMEVFHLGLVSWKLGWKLEDVESVAVITQLD